MGLFGGGEAVRTTTHRRRATCTLRTCGKPTAYFAPDQGSLCERHGVCAAMVGLTVYDLLGDVLTLREAKRRHQERAEK